MTGDLFTGKRGNFTRVHTGSEDAGLDDTYHLLHAERVLSHVNSHMTRLHT